MKLLATIIFFLLVTQAAQAQSTTPGAAFELLKKAAITNDTAALAKMSTGPWAVKKEWRISRYANHKPRNYSNHKEAIILFNSIKMHDTLTTENVVGYVVTCTTEGTFDYRYLIFCKKDGLWYFALFGNDNNDVLFYYPVLKGEMDALWEKGSEDLIQGEE